MREIQNSHFTIRVVASNLELILQRDLKYLLTAKFFLKIILLTNYSKRAKTTTASFLGGSG